MTPLKGCLDPNSTCDISDRSFKFGTYPPCIHIQLLFICVALIVIVIIIIIIKSTAHLEPLSRLEVQVWTSHHRFVGSNLRAPALKTENFSKKNIGWL